MQYDDKHLIRHITTENQTREYQACHFGILSGRYCAFRMPHADLDTNTKEPFDPKLKIADRLALAAMDQKVL